MSTRKQIRLSYIADIEGTQLICVSVTEAASMLGVGRNTIWNWLAKGVLKAKVLEGTALTRIPVSELNGMVSRSADWKPTTG